MPVSADLDPTAIRRQFDRRATPRTNADFSLARADFILREVERRLFDRLEPIRIDPRIALDLGCGLGSGAMRLAQRFERSRVIAADGSAAMAAAAARLHAPGAARRVGNWLARRVPGVRAAGPGRAEFVASDAHSLALRADTVDLVWSNLAWHWFVDPIGVIAQCHRVLRSGGLLIFSSFGVDTFRELRAIGARLAQFPDLHDIGDALVAAGFADPVLDAERITVHWESPRQLLAELRALGGNAMRDRCAGLRSRASRERWLEALGALANADGRYAVTFEIVYGHAWCPAAKRVPRGYSPVSFVARPKSDRGTRSG